MGTTTTHRADWFERIGSIPQYTMIGLFTLHTILYDWKGEGFTFWDGVGIAGTFLFVYCLFVLYGKKQARLHRLIITGPFKYTRHPMYTGIFLMNLRFWLPEPSSQEWHFFILQFLFISCLFAAAWFQEKETLARFGKEAEIYYTKTPRVFLFYPLYMK